MIRIRRLTAEDIGSAVAVEEACFSEPWSAETFRATLILPYAQYLAAELISQDGAQIVGICGVRILIDTGEITNVGVLPDHRGRGIARRMLTQLMDDAAAAGAEEFTLEVRRGNVHAISLYESLGFVTEGVRPGFYRLPDEDALIMWKRRTARQDPAAGAGGSGHTENDT